ncbi:hypothetical protein UG55_104019 [Frankia sp. EI5c]|nr:hypothetical protein UG55_104019 [Frankia sp. EI5c]
MAEPPLSPAATGVAVAGAVVLVVGCVLTSGSDDGESMASASPAGLTVDNTELTTWYSSTQGMRGSIVSTIAAARGFLDAQDGASLQPQCTQLAAQTKAALRLPAGPDAEAQAMFTSGVESYAAAAATCGQLFNGTQRPIEELQSELRTALSAGDASWGALATRTGLPAAVPLASAEQSPGTSPADSS